ncbi:MAG: transketolase [Acidobacteriota bacterium]|nr:transketolase [Acidobacteriota bacterium]
MRTAFIDALCHVAEEDERVWLLCGDLGYSVLERFAEKFPRRFLNAGVAEQNMIGVAAGLAMSGHTVFTYSIANFPVMRCLEQIRNDVCMHDLSVKIVAVGGGLSYGPAGYTHHALEDLAVMRAMPGMTVVAPGDPLEAGLATRAIADHKGPCYLRLGKAGEPVVHEVEPKFRIGEAIVVRDGEDTTLVSTGTMLERTVAAARLLYDRGISASVLSMHTVKPLDERAILRAARATRLVCVVEEHCETGGLADAVARTLSESGARCSFLALNIPAHLNGEIGSQSYLLERAGLTAEAISERVAVLLKQQLSG